MTYQKKIQKWATSVGMADDFWMCGDTTPLKEFLCKLLSSEILRASPDMSIVALPFEELLSIAQYRLGIHMCLIGSDLFFNDENMKVGLFATAVSLKSALADFKPARIPSPNFGVVGCSWATESVCPKCSRPVLFIERIVFDDQAFHRSCMHCHLCGKRLFLGTFRVVDNTLECFEHFLNQAISGNKLVSFENAKAIKSPPPRPPPPRKSISSVEGELKVSTTSMLDRELIKAQLAPNSPADKPSTNKLPAEKQPVEKPADERQPVKKLLSEKLSAIKRTPLKHVSPPEARKGPGINAVKAGLNDSSDLSAEGSNWELMEYPEQLNPFSEDEIDKLSDNMSSLNPFGDSSDEDSDSDNAKSESVPVPAPRRPKVPSYESIVVKLTEETVAEEETEAEEEEQLVKEEQSVKKEQPVKEKQPEEVEAVEEALQAGINNDAGSGQAHDQLTNTDSVRLRRGARPKLNELIAETRSESTFGLFMPCSLVLCKSRMLDLSLFDKTKLLHELDKVVKTLDYIERSAKDIERNLVKEIAKEEFRWEKNPLVDEFGKSMKLKHENLIKGTMLANEYLKKLFGRAVEKINEIDGDPDLRDKLIELQSKLCFNQTAIPSVMGNSIAKSKEQQKSKALVKRIKKVF